MKNLKYLREAHGFSQTQLAKLLNISKNTVLNWESGERQPPFEAIARLAQHLGFSLDDFAFSDMEAEGFQPKKGEKGVTGTVEQVNYVIRGDDFPTYCTAQGARFYTKALIPGITGKARTFEVTNDCMIPMLNFADWVICVPVDQVRDLETGRVFVVISTKSEVLIGYCQSYKEGIKVVPHNLICPWQMLPYDHVFEVWQVKMRLTKYFMMPYVVGEVGGSQVNEPREQQRKD